MFRKHGSFPFWFLLGERVAVHRLFTSLIILFIGWKIVGANIHTWIWILRMFDSNVDDKIFTISLSNKFDFTFLLPLRGGHGGLRYCMGFFACGISVILILTCGIAVSSSLTVCGISSFWLTVFGEIWLFTVLRYGCLRFPFDKIRKTKHSKT